MLACWKLLVSSRLVTPLQVEPNRSPVSLIIADDLVSTLKTLQPRGPSAGLSWEKINSRHSSGKSAHKAGNVALLVGLKSSAIGRFAGF